VVVITGSVVEVEVVVGGAVEVVVGGAVEEVVGVVRTIEVVEGSVELKQVSQQFSLTAGSLHLFLSQSSTLSPYSQPASRYG